MSMDKSMENKNPFNPKGKICRKTFIIYSIVYIILNSICFFFACPATVRVLAVPHLVQNKSVIEVLTIYAPGLEMHKGIAIFVIFAYLFFVIYKKRASDMNYPLGVAICLGLLGGIYFIKYNLLSNNIMDLIVCLVLFIYLAVCKVWKKGTPDNSKENICK